MATAEYTTYREQAFIYWQQAQDELEKGDLRQASEKGWGAAAQIVKAVAEHRGLEHKSHRDLFEVVSSLNNERINAGFSFANTLHINFYEGWLTENLVRQYLNSVGEFVHVLAASELGERS